MISEWDQWRKEAEAKLTKSIPPAPKLPKQEAVHRPMSQDEVIMIRKLQGVRTGGNGQAKRFIQDYSEVTLETQIAERQGWYIKALYYRYRRQLGVNPKKPEGYK